jgi:hypothetical protein
MEAEATSTLANMGISPTDDSHKYVWRQVRSRRCRFSPTGELGYRGIRARRIRIQVHCISIPLLLILSFYC